MNPSERLKFSRPLWEHQAQTLDRFADKTEMALLHEMGTGKTTSAIAWLRWKYGQASAVLPTLIVSPVATLYNWLEELERNSPPQVFQAAKVLHGKLSERIKVLKSDESTRIFITNPEIFDSEEATHALRGRNFKCLIVDEAHRFKNPKSKRLKSLTFVSDAIPNRGILTGTPILNTYLDLWAQWRILDRGETFGLNFFGFRERFFRDENIAWKGKPKYFPKYVPKSGIDVELSAYINKKSSRLRKIDCLKLPPLVRKTEYVELSPEQERVYRQMEAELVAEVNQGVCVATNALTRVLRMLQILSGYVAVETEHAKLSYKLKENPRLARLYDLLEDITPSAKVIVWCTFQENYRMIKEVCDDLGIKYAELTGQTVDRQEQIKRFQLDSSVRVMISNPQAGGVGVNLTEASYAIYYSRSFSLGDRLQSEARNHRGGSEKYESITLIDLVAKDTLDVDLLRALEQKESFSDNVLDRLKDRC